MHHLPGGGHWSTDLYPTQAGEPVVLRLENPNNRPITFTALSSSTTCNSSVKFDVKVDNVSVGWIYVAHLATVSGTIANGQSLGTVGVCNGVAHIHIELKNTSDHACWVDNGVPGTSLATTDNIGVLGSTNTAVQQACTSIPSTANNNDADFNLDGQGDIAWYESNYANGTISALLSTGTSFSASALVSGYGPPTWAGTGDFNGDGRSDVAWYHEYNQTLYLLKGDVNGSWAGGPVMSNLAKPDWAGVGDFNIDGKDDIAWYQAGNNGTITALVSTGTSFSPSAITSGYAPPTWAGTGDYNDDGRSDIAWYQESNHTLYLLKANAFGAWAGGAVLANVAKPNWAGSGDFNVDGKDDIAWYESNYANGTITAFVSTGTSFSMSALASGYGMPTWAGVGDFNKDGRSDIAWYHEYNHTLYLLKANAAGAWAGGAVLSNLAKPDWAAATK